MSGLMTLALLAVTAAGVSSSEMSDCSYLSLLTHLNLIQTDSPLSIMRPVKNWTTTTVVSLDMLLFGILEVDEKSQTVTTQVQTQMSWRNEFLNWNSSNFCGIKMLTVPRNMLWVPDVSIQEDTSDTGTIRNSPLVTLTSNGWVSASGRQRLTTTCQFKLYLFPFDTQRCKITFGSMNYDAESMILRTINSQETLSSVSELIMITQGEWELLNMTIIYDSLEKQNVAESRLIYTVIIMRKPMLYVINLIVPLFYFLILDLASFFIRVEKLSFKVTLLLSISVLLLLLQDMLPSTEAKLPLMASFCVWVFALVGLSILEAMLIDFLLGFDGCCGNNAQNAVNNQEVEIQLEGNTDPSAAEERGHLGPVMKPSEVELLMLILEEVKVARMETGRHVKDDRKPGRYTRLAQIIDSVYFVLYFLNVVGYLVYNNVEWLGSYVSNKKE
ncbi:5-hydroxytryptamine receptor 3A isoform X1 [Pleuronectes platessa]|uniref:5-hydroxytryptamine receptor 3A isoform X1 n=2 Tax=Pleuronectes platessa TaxID=8262 RepID=UPI00232A27FA|nr:5-hydroxytryptamine receptor 3A isoform X1 [Pleuronectes platessa]